MNIPSSAVCRMVENNEHNKYITAYYLLKMKHEKGDLDLSEYEIEENPIELIKKISKKERPLGAKQGDNLKKMKEMGRKAQKRNTSMNQDEPSISNSYLRYTSKESSRKYTSNKSYKNPVTASLNNYKKTVLRSKKKKEGGIQSKQINNS